MRVAYLIAAVLLVPYASAHAGELYKWTDENGRTHYSDKPPAGKVAEARAVAPVADSSPLPMQSKENAERCAKLQDAKRVLETFDKVEADVNGDGVPEMLNEEQKKRELDRANNMIERLCKNAPPPAVAAEPAEKDDKSDSGEQIADDRDYFADDKN